MGLGETDPGPDVRFDDVVACAAGPGRENMIGELLSRMTLEEKVSQMSGSASLFDLLAMIFTYGRGTYDSGANERLGIPPIRFTDGPRGVCLGRATCFPVAMGRAATWDIELEEQVGSAMGREARAQGANFFGGVCVNVPRHPGWGRSQETFGEDPFLLGEIGAATVRGAQRHVMACAKHFACNSMEEARFHVDVAVDERTLREIYLPHFRRCVDEGVACIMSAYNRVNGEHCGHNGRLLREILKKEWGFTGFVMSDFVFGVRNGVRAALGGMDVEMPYRWRYGYGFKRKVKRGMVPVETIDEAARRVIRTKAAFARAGEGDYDPAHVGSERHAELALAVARESIVMLKNRGKTLPLDRSTLSRLAVIGPLADRENIGDMGSSRVKPPYVVTPLAGIKKLAAGEIEIVHDSGSDPGRAGALAREADASVVVVGLTRKDEGEYMPVIHTGGDRLDLRLPRGQAELVSAVASEGGPCVVVLEGGSAIVTEPWINEVDSLLMAWYPGMEGGNAIAGVLFGEVNPSGKLPITFPASNDQNPSFDRKARRQEYGYYHGYRLFNERGMKPSFAFGFGLSYTVFKYSALHLDQVVVMPGGGLTVDAVVSNTGDVAGTETAQLYVGYGSSRTDRPVRELKGFTRVTLPAGESAGVRFRVEARDLARYDPGTASWIVDPGEYYVYVGSSSREEDLVLRARFTVAAG